MITGVLSVTTGSIKILGFESKTQRNEIKKLMGFCPQTNPIFNFMTVEEHLILYCKLKGVKEN